jgi:hypothetical protein
VVTSIKTRQGHGYLGAPPPSSVHNHPKSRRAEPGTRFTMASGSWLGLHPMGFPTLSYMLRGVCQSCGARRANRTEAGTPCTMAKRLHRVVRYPRPTRVVESHHIPMDLETDALIDVAQARLRQTCPATKQTSDHRSRSVVMDGAAAWQRCVR